MDTDDKTVQKLEKMFNEMDDWFIKYGHIPAHAHNRVIERLSKEVKGVKPGNIEYYVDSEERRIDLTVYFPFWKLVFMFLFRRSSKKLSQIIAIVEEILSGYEIRAKLARRKRYETLSNSPVNASKFSSISEGELPTASNLLPDTEEQVDDQEELRDEAEQPDLQVSEKTQDTE